MHPVSYNFYWCFNETACVHRLTNTSLQCIRNWWKTWPLRNCFQYYGTNARYFGFANKKKSNKFVFCDIIKFLIMKLDALHTTITSLWKHAERISGQVWKLCSTCCKSLPNWKHSICCRNSRHFRIDLEYLFTCSFLEVKGMFGDCNPLLIARFNCSCFQ